MSLNVGAELLAKKHRIKQSLIKRARSVAIFSLKLKERRARDAEHAHEQHQQQKVLVAFLRIFNLNILVLGSRSAHTTPRW